MAQFTLTETEKACGVTVAEAREAAGRAYFCWDERSWILEPVAPAVAGAAVRLLSQGENFKFAGFNTLGHLVFA